MSKKHKKMAMQAQAENSAVLHHGVEYNIIKHDLWKVLILNLIYLAAVLVLYFSNSRTHYLENWFGKIFHF
jgi:hypothetical protein